MVPKKKEYSFDIRETVIKHFLNGDSEHEIQFIISSRNTKKTRYIGNIIGRGRKCKTSVHFDRVIQKKIKVDRRKSASSVKVEIETELRVIISEQTVRHRLHEAGFKGRVARKKPYQTS
jgi:predicted subunit of tRNA(5-methylaminomethyl-2-thiouridylate) methyltransferase